LKKIYDKNPLVFAIMMIAVYVVGTSFTDSVGKGITFAYHLLLTIVLYAFAVNSGLKAHFGLIRPAYPSKTALYWLPLALMCTCNMWFGVTINMPLPETVFYIGSMLCVGFLEEFIFRGLLFRAMEKDGLVSAIIVSSLTFGIGHIINLFNGSGMQLVANLCQVVYATAFGYLCVVLLYKGGSLLPCIAVHSIVNALSAFAVTPSPAGQILSAAILTAIELSYAVYLNKNLPYKKAGE